MHSGQYMFPPKQSLHLYSPTSFVQLTQIPGVVGSPKPSMRSNSSSTIGRYASQSAILVYRCVINGLVEGVGMKLTLSFSFTILTLLRFATNLRFATDLAGGSLGSGSAGALMSSTVGGSSRKGSGELS